MRTLSTAIAVVGILLGSGLSTAAYAQKNTCKDIPLQWFIYSTAETPDGQVVSSSILGDAKWYSSASGTSNTVIHVCGTQPTYDATMLVGGKRKVAFVFDSPVAGSIQQESIPAATYQDSPFMNVRNILCVGCADKTAPFTSRMGMQLKMNSQSYHLRFMPEFTDAPDRHTNPEAIPGENTPYQASPVLVIPQPYDCHAAGTIRPSWIVRGAIRSSDPAVPASENLQVGTLRRVTRTGTVHAGQYSLPFEIRIEALSCFSY